MKSPVDRKSTRKKIRPDRHIVSIPVTLGKKTGIVKDISATGIYFEIDCEQKVGSDITFELELMTPGGPIRVNCKGHIVRLENKGKHVGIAAKIEDSEFKS